MSLRDKFSIKLDCCRFRQERRLSRRVNAQDVVSSKIDEATRTRTF